ncbi:VOC family protein [Ornithinimicrobium sp. W1665]|uniref:VOC family protein n=1 Tax=Ornithinimicrobium sp. W1665 TaxID=3416666 RepID=UPI003CEADA22
MTTLQLTPKLVIGRPDEPGGADRAIAYYRQVLGAEVVSRHTMGRAVVLAELALPGGSSLQVKDADEHDPGSPEQGRGVILSLVCADPDALVSRALDGGGELVFPVQDQPYGSRQGRFRDPFGHQWIVGTPLTMSEAQIQDALDAWDAAEEGPQDS